MPPPPSSKVDGPVAEAIDPIIPNTTVKPELLEEVRAVPRPPVPPRNDVGHYLAKRGNKLAEEENPFDSQFGGGPIPKSNSTKTPGGTIVPLPSFAALQSGSGSSFLDGLRRGPLSPSMLTGPKEDGGDYFNGDHMNLNDGPRVFTPNESALRHQTMLPSLSPGGNAMFSSSLGIPGMPSPGIFGGSAVATPGTAEFNRTASEIRERQRATIAQKERENITSQPQQMNEDSNNDMGTFVEDNQSNAAASLFMLANSASSRDSSPYNIAMGQPRQAQPSAQKQIVNHRNQQMLNQQMNQQMNPIQVNGQLVGQSNNPPLMNGHSMNPSPRNNSIPSNSSSPISNSNNMGYDNELNGAQSTTGRKRGAPKRKSNGPKTPPKNTKRIKVNNGVAPKKLGEMKHEDFTNEDLDDMEDQEGDFEGNEENNDKGKPKKPETDDEKRKSFLERNRVAALKCRQRKKQWLNNLQSKVDTYTTELENLHHKNQMLTNEIIHLKTMLLAHKDCPLGLQQSVEQYIMAPPVYQDQHMHQAQDPYGMAGMPPQNPGMQ
ncbi:Transcription factor [Ciborinia camelliae]|nr:Transcription factor [Ciborinia camelliae]